MQVQSKIKIIFFSCLVLMACRTDSRRQVDSENQTPSLPVYSQEIARVGPFIVKEDWLRFRYRLELDKFPEEFIEKYKKEPFNETNPLKIVFDRVLNKVIEDHLILAYGENKGIAIPEEELQNRFERKMQDMSQKELESLLNEKSIPFRRWKDLVQNDIKIQFILAEVLSKDLEVKFSEMRNYYEGHKNEFEVTEQVRVRQIVTDTKEKAEEIHKRLRSGENFAKLAVNHSQSPDRAKGGDLGYFSKGIFPAEFDEVCFNLEKGEISSVIKSNYGFHIFKLIDKKPPGIKKLSQVMGPIHGQLFEEKLQKKYIEWIGEVRKEIPVLLDEKNLENFLY